MKRRGFLGSMMAVLASPAISKLPVAASPVGVAASQFKIAHTASAVNYIASAGAAFSMPRMAAAGADTNIGFERLTKGGGTIKFRRYQPFGGSNV